MLHARRAMVAVPRIELRLYIADQTAKSRSAVGNVARLCERYLYGRCRVEVIDLVADPQRAQADGIVAIPTLVRRFPEPSRRVLGDCADDERVLAALDIPILF